MIQDKIERLYVNVFWTIVVEHTCNTIKEVRAASESSTN